MKLPHAAFHVRPLSTFAPPQIPKGRTFYRTDERCRVQGRARYGVTKSCGKQALLEINGCWVCSRHAKKAGVR